MLCSLRSCSADTGASPGVPGTTLPDWGCQELHGVMAETGLTGLFCAELTG